MQRTESHLIRKQKDICIMKASDVSKPHMLIELKYTTPSIYLIKSRCNSAGSHVNTFFTPFTALLETLLLINSEFKGGGCFQGICQKVAANFLMLVNLSETVHIFITLIPPFVVE